jgi:hypothetical protein
MTRPQRQEASQAEIGWTNHDIDWLNRLEQLAEHHENVLRGLDGRTKLEDQPRRLGTNPEAWESRLKQQIWQHEYWLGRLQQLPEDPTDVQQIKQIWRHKYWLDQLEQLNRRREYRSSRLEEHGPTWLNTLEHLALVHELWLSRFEQQDGQHWSPEDWFRHCDRLVMHHDDWLYKLEQQLPSSNPRHRPMRFKPQSRRDMSRQRRLEEDTRNHEWRLRGLVRFHFGLKELPEPPEHQPGRPEYQPGRLGQIN